MVSPSPVIKAFYLQAVCCFFRTVDLPTPLCREGGLFFLPDEYFSFATDKIWGRGRMRSVISIRFFFHNHSDLSVLESGRSADICVPYALT